MSSENDVSFEKFFSTRAHDEGAGALASHEQAFVHEAVDGLAHGDARDRELGRQVALGGQRVVGSQQTALHRLAQRPLQLLVKGQAARFIEHSYGLRQQGQTAFSGDGSARSSYYQYHTN